MIWIDNINNLGYYHPVADVPCYCEALVYPSDLILQGQLSSLATSGYDIKVYVYSADGLTQYENATTYFLAYVGQNPVTGKPFFNIKLKTYSPAMCTYSCYILRVVVSQGGNDIFNKFTERYCQSSCCETPKGVIIEQIGISPRQPYRIGTPDPAPVAPARPATECGTPLIQIRTTFDCLSNENGDYYGTPSTVYYGTASFAFQKVVNVAAKVVQRPREIKREISYNCKVQRSESFRPYVLQSTGWTANSMFPLWKMNEIEDMFEGNHIYINDFVNPEREYVWAGGTLMQQVYKCWETFKLSTTLQDCTHRQNFGCGDACDATGYFFGIGARYAGNGFYSDDRQMIAEDLPGLMNYYSAQEGVTDITDLSGAFPELTAAFKVSSTALIPTSFYMDAPTARNKVFATTTPNVAATEGAQPPIIGTIAIEDNVTQVPDITTVDVSNGSSMTGSISGFDNWVAFAPSESVVSGAFGMLSIDLRNDTMTDPEVSYVLAADTVALVTAAGIPTQPVLITNEVNGNIPAGSALSIDTNGLIRWYGPVPAQLTGYAQILLLNIPYKL